VTEQVLRGELTHKVLSMCKLKNYGVLECKEKTSLAAKRQACTTRMCTPYHTSFGASDATLTKACCIRVHPEKR